MTDLVTPIVKLTTEEEQEFAREIRQLARKSLTPEMRAAALAAEAAKKAAAEKAIEEAKAADAQAWAEAKAAVEARAVAQSVKPSSAGETILQAIERLALKAVEADQHVDRLNRLEAVLGPGPTSKMQHRARRSSKDLQDGIARLLDGSLEKVFAEFDTDGSGTLDAEELSDAYAAAGISISPENLKKCMRLLDTNGDNLIDLEEFKSLAVKVKMMDCS